MIHSFIENSEKNPKSLYDPNYFPGISIFYVYICDMLYIQIINLHILYWVIKHIFDPTCYLAKQFLFQVFAIWKMLARNLCNLSKSAVRTASAVSQIPAMRFSTDLKVSANEQKVISLLFLINYVAFLQAF